MSKGPLKLKEIWAIRIRLKLSHRVRDLVIFNLASYCKFRGCDLVKPKVSDISHVDRISARTKVMQHKRSRSVQIEITEQTRNSTAQWMAHEDLGSDSYLSQVAFITLCIYLFKQYSRIVHRWVKQIGLDPINYGSHRIPRTKATFIKSTNLKIKVGSTAYGIYLF